jgi:hypothetical protein
MLRSIGLAYIISAALLLMMRKRIRDVVAPTLPPLLGLHGLVYWALPTWIVTLSRRALTGLEFPCKCRHTWIFGPPLVLVHAIDEEADIGGGIVL